MSLLSAMSVPEYVTDPEDVEITPLTLIGRGGYGEVYKVIRPFAGTSTKDIQNEVRAISELYKLDGHPNLVTLLHHRPRASGGNEYFIDMELCNFSLADRLSLRRQAISASVHTMADSGRTATKHSGNIAHEGILHPRGFLEEDCWTILTQITQGVEFIHNQGQAHRDLKPHNVLYSQAKDLWKISDFGLTSAVNSTSGAAVTSSGARGSQGYRAPELLVMGKLKFNKKVDLWGLGCILYELATGRRAFQSDLAVSHYSTDDSNTGPSVTAAGLPRVIEIHLNKLLQDLFHRDPQQRPRASDLHRLFRYYSTLFRESLAVHLNEHESFPTYSQLMHNFAGEHLNSALAGWYKTHSNDAAIAVLWAFVDNNPTHTALQHCLREMYDRKGSWGTAVQGWKELVRKHPAISKLRNQLESACERNGNIKETIALWKELLENYKYNKHFQYNLTEAYTAAYDKHGENDKIVELWTDYVDQNPGDARGLSRLGHEMKQRKPTATVITWTTLVDQHPDEIGIVAKLEESLGAATFASFRVSIWKDRVSKHPYNEQLQGCLNIASARLDASKCKTKPEAVAIWMSLVQRYPGRSNLQQELKQACREAGDEEGAIEVWIAIVNEHPDVWGLLLSLERACKELGDLERTVAVWGDIVDRHPNKWGPIMCLEAACQELGDEETAARVWKDLAGRHHTQWISQDAPNDALVQPEFTGDANTFRKQLANKIPENIKLMYDLQRAIINLDGSLRNIEAKRREA